MPLGYENVGVPIRHLGEFGFDFVIGRASYGKPERIVQKAEIDPLCYALLAMDWNLKVQERLKMIWNKRQLPLPGFEKLEVLDDPGDMRLYTTRITYRLVLQPNLEWLLQRLQEKDFVKDTEDDEDEDGEDEDDIAPRPAKTLRTHARIRRP